MSNYLLECQNINKFYQEGENQTQVLKGVSFAMKPQELVAIVGSSGSGKSTLLHTLGGLDQPSSGEVFIKGQSLQKASESELAKLRNQNLGFVYCGPYPLFVENIDQAKEALAAFMAENDKEPRLILVQGVGAFIMEDDKGKAAKAQLLAKDAIKLAVYAESFGGPLQMTDEITYFITHWEAEAYRSKK